MFMKKMKTQNWILTVSFLAMMVFFGKSSTAQEVYGDWAFTHIGDEASSAEIIEDTIRITASNGNAWKQNPDSTNMVYRMLVGDGYIKAYIPNMNSLDTNGTDIFQGVLFRDDLSDTSKLYGAYMYLNNENQSRGPMALWRTEKGLNKGAGRAKWNTANGLDEDVQSGWLMVKREGNFYSAWWSKNDDNYRLIGWRDRTWNLSTQEIQMNDTIYAGVEMTAVDTFTADFWNVEVGTLPNAPSTPKLTVGEDMFSLDISWDGIEGADSYNVYYFTTYNDHPWACFPGPPCDFYDYIGKVTGITDTNINLDSIMVMTERIPDENNTTVFDFKNPPLYPVRYISNYNPVGIKVTAVVNGIESAFSETSHVSWPEFLAEGWMGIEYGNGEHIVEISDNGNTVHIGANNGSSDYNRARSFDDQASSVYQQLIGDGYIKAYISDATQLDTFGHQVTAGVVMREDLSPKASLFGSYFWFQEGSANRSTFSLRRTESGSRTSESRSKWNVDNGLESDITRGYLLVKREGNLFSAWWSPDDMNYRLVGWRDRIFGFGTEEIAMNDTIYAGVEFTTNGDSSAVTFENVEVGPLPSAPKTPVVKMGEDMFSLDVSWEEVENADSYNIYYFTTYQDHPWACFPGPPCDHYGYVGKLIGVAETSINLDSIIVTAERVPDVDNNVVFDFENPPMYPVRFMGNNSPVGISVTAVVNGVESAWSGFSHISWPEFLADGWNAIQYGKGEKTVEVGTQGDITIGTQSGFAYNTPDEVTSVYKQLSGDVYIKAYIPNTEMIDTFGVRVIGGPVFREKLSPNSKQFGSQLFLNEENGSRGPLALWRSVENGAKSNARTKWNSDNQVDEDIKSGWLMVKRQDDLFSAWWSEDDSDYRLVGWRDRLWTFATENIPMNDTIYAGIDLSTDEDSLGMSFEHVEMDSLPEAPEIEDVTLDLSTLNANISWSEVQGATKYKIYVYTTFSQHPWACFPDGPCDVYLLYGTTEATGTSASFDTITFADQQMPPEYTDLWNFINPLEVPVFMSDTLQYGFRVTAVVDGIESGWSEEVSATWGTVGVKNVNIPGELTVYPNPVESNSKLNILLDMNIENTSVLMVYNSIGDLVEKVNISAQKGSNLTVDVSAYAQGLYIIKLKTGNRFYINRFLK